jgi:hypothetical protein
MLEQTARLLLDRWEIGEARVFIYHNYWMVSPEEVIIIHRLDKHYFKTDAEKSTINPGFFTNTELIALLVDGKLVEKLYGSVNINYRTERNGGCECGAWRTNNPKLHTHKCPKYTRY